MTVWEDVRGRVVRIVARASTRFGRIRATLARWDGQGLEPEPSRKTWVHRWLPFAIVLVSSAAAAMAWQASVAEERAAHKDVLSRQDLVREQQIDLQKVQEVDADLRVFGESERLRLLADQLERDSRRLGGGEGRTLASEARADRLASASLVLQFYAPGVRTGAPYDVQSELTARETGDTGLASLEPNRLRKSAHHQRMLALHVAGLLVLFIAALVLVTMAMVSRGRVSYWFAGSGAVTALAATVLFFVVRLG